MRNSISHSLLLAALVSLPLTAQSALMSRLGGQAYYDDVLDVTWQADANLAVSNSFGVSGIDPFGLMSWDTANDWIAGMNAASYLGFDDWRLPTLSPVSGGATFDVTPSNNGTTDRGNGATGVGWQTAGGAIVSEMGWMYYGNLGNLGYWTPNDSDPGAFVEQPGFGLVNRGPFLNLLPSAYWSGVESNVLSAWNSNFASGAQQSDQKSGQFSGRLAWAVRSGDVGPAAAVPEPGTMMLVGAALTGLVGFRRRSRTAGA